MNRRTLIFIVVISTLLISSGIYIYKLGYQNGSYFLARGYSDDKIVTLVSVNHHLSNVLNEEHKINFNTVTLADDMKATDFNREQIHKHKILEESSIHKNILWAYHLRGVYKPSQQSFTIPLDNGLFVTIKDSNENRYQIIEVYQKDGS